MKSLRFNFRQKLFVFFIPWFLVNCSFHYDQGMKLEQEQRWAEAAIEYRIAAIEDPDNEEIREALTRMNIRVAAENFEIYKQYLKEKKYHKAFRRLETALSNNPGKTRPIFATMRHTVVYDKQADWEIPVNAAIRQLSQFENLFKNLGDVKKGFPFAIEFSQLANRDEYDPQMLQKNMMFGTPEEVITKLRLYEDIGVDHFIYYSSLGLGLKEQKRSLELFVNEVANYLYYSEVRVFIVTTDVI